ncbi:unnamed protein product [Mesocestoides corti]|uniref:PWWP domain-containing protein n=1 Tax=Mesocestoides corti TaxID=53468 RepID=A0A0R3UN61_MESCO|nr:unnamed protein product [Mesocestoides corti]
MRIFIDRIADKSVKPNWSNCVFPRIGVNEHRTVGAPSWSLSLANGDGCLPLKTPSCAVERYTYKAEGEPSRLAVFRSTPKRAIASSCTSLLPTSSLPTPPPQPRAVIRAPNLPRCSIGNFICRKCRKALSPPATTQETPSTNHRHSSSSKPAKRKERPDAAPPAKPSTSLKKQRPVAEDETSTEPPKSKKRKQVDELSAAKKKAECLPDFTHTPSPIQNHLKKRKEEVPAVRPPKDKIKAQSASLLQSARATIISPKSSDAVSIVPPAKAPCPHSSSPFRPQRPHKKSKSRSIRAERDSEGKGVNGASTESPCSPAATTSVGVERVDVPEKAEPAPSPRVPSAVTPPLPPIKIKINRCVLSSNGEGSNSDQGKGSDSVNEYQVQVMLNDLSEAVATPPLLPSQKPPPPSPPKETSNAELSPMVTPSQSQSGDSRIPSPHTQPPLGADERLVKCYRLPETPSTVFRVGDVVWCKLAGWPWWPARITSLRRSDASCDACVRWFAWDQVSYFPCDKLLPFLAYYDRKVDKRRVKKRGAYKQAVEDAREAAQERAAQPPPSDEDVSGDEEGASSDATAKSSAPLKVPRKARPKSARSEVAEAPESQKTPTPTNGLPAAPPSDESESEFDGGGPLVIDPAATGPKTLDSDAGESRVFLSTPTKSCPILQQH